MAMYRRMLSSVVHIHFCNCSKAVSGTKATSGKKCLKQLKNGFFQTHDTISCKDT